MKPSVLFVCLGNICRSPLAEAAFRREAERRGFDVQVDSAGTGTWNLGTLQTRGRRRWRHARGSTFRTGGRG